jgi:hypothetical protein
MISRTAADEEIRATSHQPTGLEARPSPSTGLPDNTYDPAAAVAESDGPPLDGCDEGLRPAAASLHRRRAGANLCTCGSAAVVGHGSAAPAAAEATCLLTKALQDG